MDSVIFLDFDGVLNSLRSCIAFETYQRFDPVAVKLVRRLCDETYSKIVVSSTWRLGHNIESLQLEMHNAGAGSLTSLVVGRTPDTLGIRGDQIRVWLRANPVRRYVIIDDDSDMHPDQYLVKTDHAIGMDSRAFKAAKEALAAQDSREGKSHPIDSP